MQVGLHVAVTACVNSCLLSLSIINDTISSWAVWQNCYALIVERLAGNLLPTTKQNNYWFFCLIVLNRVLAVWEKAPPLLFCLCLQMKLSYSVWMDWSSIACLCLLNTAMTDANLWIIFFFLFFWFLSLYVC